MPVAQLRRPLRRRRGGTADGGGARRAAGGARLSWFLAFAGFSALIILHELGPLRGGEGDRHAGRSGSRSSSRRTSSRKRRGETEYCVGALPLGGFVKITGMNPEEELPPDVAPRAYYHQPVWKRIVVIGAGPVVNLADRVLAPVRPRVRRRARPSRAWPTSRPDSAAARGPAARRPDHLRGRRAAATRPTLARQISSHQLRGRSRGPGCRAATPAVLRVERDGRVLTIRVRPRYDAEAKRTVIGFSFGRDR